jgi:hypothetical protein
MFITCNEVHKKTVQRIVKKIAKKNCKKKSNTGFKPFDYLPENPFRIESKIYVKSHGEENEICSNDMRKQVALWA